MNEIFEVTETDKKRAADELNEPEDTSQAATYYTYFVVKNE